MFGGKGRHHLTYSAPLIDRLNTRCQQLFGETVEKNFHAPANIPSAELLGLEYLFSQSTGESGPFSLKDIVLDGPDEEDHQDNLNKLRKMKLMKATRRPRTMRWFLLCLTSHSPALRRRLLNLRPLWVAVTFFIFFPGGVGIKQL